MKAATHNNKKNAPGDFLITPCIQLLVEHLEALEDDDDSNILCLVLEVESWAHIYIQQ